MTVKISVSLPDDVAARLAERENVSAYIAEAVRQRLVSDDTRAALAAAGFQLSPPDRRAAAQRLDEVRQAITPEMRDEVLGKIAASMGRPVDEVRQHFDGPAKQ